MPKISCNWVFAKKWLSANSISLEKKVGTCHKQRAIKSFASKPKSRINKACNRNIHLKLLLSKIPLPALSTSIFLIRCEHIAIPLNPFEQFDDILKSHRSHLALNSKRRCWNRNDRDFLETISRRVGTRHDWIQMNLFFFLRSRFQRRERDSIMPL